MSASMESNSPQLSSSVAWYKAKHQDQFLTVVKKLTKPLEEGIAEVETQLASRREALKQLSQEDGSFSIRDPGSHELREEAKIFLDAVLELITKITNDLSDTLLTVIKSVEQDTSLLELVEPSLQKVLPSIGVRNTHNIFNHQIPPLVGAMCEIERYRNRDKYFVVNSEQFLGLFDKINAFLLVLKRYISVLHSGPAKQVQIQSVNAFELIEQLKTEAIDRLSRESGIQLSIEVPKDLESFRNLTLDSDLMLIKEAFRNLIENAIEHLNSNPGLSRNIDVDFYIRRDPKFLGIRVMNPAEITIERFKDIRSFKSGLTHKDGFTGESKDHGIGLVSTRNLCQSSLASDLTIDLDTKNLVQGKPRFIAQLGIKSMD